MDDQLNRMYACQSIQQSGGGETICNSAKLHCSNGTADCILNLEQDHGRYIGDQAVIDAKDSQRVETQFGYCSYLDGPCNAVLSDWQNANREDLMFDEMSLKMEEAVPQNDGYVVCYNMGEVKALTSGQQMKKSKKEKTEYYKIHINEEFNVFDLSRDMFKADEFEEKIICTVSPKKECQIRVKNDGYYRLRIYSDSGNNLDGSEIILDRKNEQYTQIKKETFYLRPYNETMYSQYDTNRGVSLGDISSDDIKICTRYQTRMYLKRNVNYNLEYAVNGVSEFNLIFGIYADQYQYDCSIPFSDKPNDNTIFEKVTKEKMGYKFITKTTTLDQRMKQIYSSSEFPTETVTKGIYCALIWEMDANCDKTGPYLDGEYGNMKYYYEMPKQVFYLDQMFGGWLLNKLDIIYHEIESDKEKANKAKQFFAGLAESSISTAASWAAGKLVTVAATSVSMAVGLAVSAFFLVVHSLDTETPFKLTLDSLRKYNENSDSRLSLTCPISIALIEKKYMANINNASTLEAKVSSWDGTTVTAIGGKYYHGKYSYTNTTERELKDLYKILEDAIGIK